MRRIRPRSKLRVLTVIGALISAASLAACGTTAPPAAPSSSPDASAGGAESVELSFQTWSDASWMKKWEGIYNELHPEAPVVVEAKAAGQNGVESLQAYRLALSAGKDIPDMLHITYSNLAELVEAGGIVADVSSFVEPHLAGLAPAGVRLSEYGGKYWAFPVGADSKLWFYRADMFEEAGIDVDAIQTQADFVAAGRKLQEKYPKSWIWNLGPKPQHYSWGNIVTGNGARFSAREPVCEFVMGDDPGTIKAFSALKELRESGVVNPTIDDWAPEWEAGLADGTIASTLNASWMGYFLKQYAPDLAGKWGVRTWPVIGDAHGGSQNAGAVILVSAASQNIDAAARFLATLTLQEDGAQAALEAGAGSSLSLVTSALDSDYLKNDSYFGPQFVQAYKESLSDEQFKVFAYDTAAAAEQSALQTAIVKYLASDDADPSAYLQAVEDELNAQIGCPYPS